MGVRSVAGQELRTLVQAALAQTPHARSGAPTDAQGPAPKVDSAEAPQANVGAVEEKVRKAAEAVNQDPILQQSGVRLRIDRDTSRIVVQILDSNNQVIRQIPPDDLLKIAARAREIQGLLFDKHA